MHWATLEMFKITNKIHCNDTWLCCNNCKDWLLPPLFLHPDKKHYCNTCNATKEGGIENYVLQTLIRNCKYPCKHKDCFQWLKPEELRKHEQQCQYMQFNCNLCDCKFMTDAKYVDHLLSTHSSICAKIKINSPLVQLEIDKAQTFEKVVIAEYKSIEFLVQIKCTAHSMLCWVAKVPNDDKHDSTNKTEIHIRTANECVSDKHIGSIIQVKQLGDVGTSHVSIPMNTVKGTKEKLKLIVTFNKVLSTLNCSICMHELTSTIKLCANGHSVCINCSSKMDSCVICNTLTNSVKVMQPHMLCPYADVGCDQIISSLNDLSAPHLKVCRYRPTVCPECKESIPTNALIQHLQKKQHIYVNKFIMDNYTIISNRLVTAYCKYDEQLFRFLSIPIYGNSFAVQLINCDDVNIAKQYRYVIKFYDQSMNQCDSVLKGSCQLESDNTVTSTLSQEEYQRYSFQITLLCCVYRA